MRIRRSLFFLCAGGSMTDIVRLLLFVLAYIALMRWVLPRLGVPT